MAGITNKLPGLEPVNLGQETGYEKKYGDELGGVLSEKLDENIRDIIDQIKEKNLVVIKGVTYDGVEGTLIQIDLENGKHFKMIVPDKKENIHRIEDNQELQNLKNFLDEKGLKDISFIDILEYLGRGVVVSNRL